MTASAQVPDPPMISDAVLDFLNYAVLVNAILCRTPQILAILKKRSVKGISERSYILEVMAGSLSVSYNFLRGFPMLTWLDVFSFTIQCQILVLLFWYFERDDDNYTKEKVKDVAEKPEVEDDVSTTAESESSNKVFNENSSSTKNIADTKDSTCKANSTKNGNKKLVRTLGVVFYLAFFLALLPQLVELFPPVLTSVGIFNILICILSRASQMVQNFKQKHTGNVSRTAFGMSFCANNVRILTTVIITKDVVSFCNHFTAWCLNGGIVLQTFIFAENTKRVMQNVGKKEKTA